MTDNNDNFNSANPDQLDREFDELDMNLFELFQEEIPAETFSLHAGESSSKDPVLERYDELTEHDVKRRYAIQEKMDVGGMKSIWRVEDIHTDRQIAMAVINDNKMVNAENCDAFIREARITANLQHPNIVPVYDVSLDDNGSPYFTMKALKGETLERIITAIVRGEGDYRERFSRMNLISIFQKVCDAIAYAHSKGVVHLDLKPSNIIVCDYGEVQVVDWGISQSVADITNLNIPAWNHGEVPKHMTSTHTICKVAEISNSEPSTTLGVIAGSPGYMSPEQVQGELAEIDLRTDIYSLGAILYYMLSGRKPVSGNTLQLMLDNTEIGLVDQLHGKTISGYGSHALEAIALKALSVRKEDRYQSVEIVLRDLGKYLDGFATIAESATFITHLQLLIKRHKFVALVICFSMILLSIIVSISLISINKQKEIAEHQKDVAENQREIAESAHEKTEKHLSELQTKTDYISSLTKQVAPLCHKAAYGFYLDNRFYAFTQNLDMALKFDSTLMYVWNHKIHQLVAEQKFNEALHLVEEHSVPRGLVWEAYAELKPFAIKKDDGELLTNEDDIIGFIKIIDRFKRDYYTRYIFHEMNKKEFEPKQRFEVIKKLLYYFNPDLKNLQFRYAKVDGGWNIDISNNPNLVHAYPLCGLTIVKLKAENTGIRTFDMITRWGVKEINVANSPIKTLVGRELLISCQKVNFSGTKFPDINYFYSLPEIRELILLDMMNVDTPKVKINHRATVYVDNEVKDIINIEEAEDNGFHFIFDMNKY